jgi:hypothetical protein
MVLRSVFCTAFKLRFVLRGVRNAFCNALRF